MAEGISLGLGLSEINMYLPIATAYNSAQNLELRFKASKRRTVLPKEDYAEGRSIECLCALCDYGNGFGI